MAKIIVIEGIDGAGKTTIAKRLKKMLGDEACFISKKSIDAKTVFQKRFMSELKPILWGHKADEKIYEIDEITWLYLHMLWYHMLQEYVISPKLNQYKYVIMDGWFYKFLARHYVNNQRNCELANYLFRKLLKPDYIFLLRASPELCYIRKGNVKPSECGVHNNRILTESSVTNFCKYQEEVYEAYLQVFENADFTVIDAEQKIDSIIKTIILEVNNDDSNKTKNN